MKNSPHRFTFEPLVESLENRFMMDADQSTTDDLVDDTAAEVGSLLTAEATTQTIDLRTLHNGSVSSGQVFDVESFGAITIQSAGNTWLDGQGLRGYQTNMGVIFPEPVKLKSLRIDHLTSVLSLNVTFFDADGNNMQNIATPNSETYEVNLENVSRIQVGYYAPTAGAHFTLNDLVIEKVAEEETISDADIIAAAGPEAAAALDLLDEEEAISSEPYTLDLTPLNIGAVANGNTVEDERLGTLTIQSGGNTWLDGQGLRGFQTYMGVTLPEPMTVESLKLEHLTNVPSLNVTFFDPDGNNLQNISTPSSDTYEVGLENVSFIQVGYSANTPEAHFVLQEIRLQPPTLPDLVVWDQQLNALSQGVDASDNVALRYESIATQGTALSELSAVLIGAYGDAQANNDEPRMDEIGLLMIRTDELIAQWQIQQAEVAIALEHQLPNMQQESVDLSGCTILYAEDHASVAIDMELLGGKAYIVSYQGVMAQPATLASDQNTLVATGRGMSIDLRDTLHLVTDVSFHVDGTPGQEVTASFYRGQQLISTRTVVAGSVIQFDDDEGITSVVIDSNAITLKDLELTGDVHALQANAEPLSGATNGTLSQMLAYTWPEATDEDYIQWALNHGVSTGNVNGGPTDLEGKLIDSNQYVRVDSWSQDGPASLGQVWYVTEAGLIPVPEHMYTHQGSAVVLHPGSPRYVAFSKVGTGTQIGTSNSSYGETMEAVALKEGVHVQPEIGQLSAQFGQEGFVQGNAIQEHGSRVIGTSGQISVVLANTGTSSGSITVHVYEGETGTDNDELQGTYSTPIAQGETLTLNANVSGGSFGSSERRYITIIAEMPDGTTYKSQMMGLQASSNEVRSYTETVDAAGNYTQILTYNTVPPTSAEAQRIVRAAEEARNAYVLRDELGTTYAFDDQIDYNEGLSQTIALYEDALERERGGVLIVEEGTTELALDDEAVVQDAIDTLLLQKDELVNSQIYLAAARSGFIWEEYGVDDESTQFSFGDEIAQLLDVLGKNNVLAASNTVPLQGDTVTLAWNFGDAHTAEDFAYLRLDAKKLEEGTESIPIMHLRDLDVALRNDYSFAIGEEGKITENGSYRIYITAQLHNGRFVGGYVNLEVGSNIVTTENLSVTGDAQENAILSAALNAKPNFVFGSSSTEWYQLLASGYHDGNGFHALDFNRIDESESLGNEKAYALGEGEVVFVNHGGENESSVVIVKQNINGTEFFLKYLHMKDISVEVGDTTTADTALGTIADVGSEGAHHLHLEIMKTINGAAIDARKLVTNELGISVEAWAFPDANSSAPDGPGDTMKVIWSDEVSAWISEEYGLIYDRSAQVESTSEFATTRWLAYHSDPSQRFEVRWIHQLASGEIVDQWYSLDGTKIWNSQEKRWE